MNLRLQPKPEVEIQPADRGIVSRKNYFVEKKIEQINQYFFPAHFVRHWRPKAYLIYPQVSDESAIRFECDFNRNVQNCFVEDYAEEVFLRTPPPCFLVIGKFGESVSKLSEEIAKEYGSVLIQVDNVVSQVMKSESETSKFLDRVLRLGVSITLNFILALLSYVAHTAEARHRGYVLCGLPSSSYLYDLSVEQQFNYLFTWENKPTVFINVLYEDEDLVRARTNLRYEVESVGRERYTSLRPQFNDKNNEEEEEEEENEDASPKEAVASDLNISPSRPWVQLPRDKESQVWSELELFDNKIKPGIDLITSRVDPQYFITVDSRVKNEFEMVRARLSLLQVWKVPTAFPFITPKKDFQIKEVISDEEVKGEETEEDKSLAESEEDIEINQVMAESPQTAFLTLFSKKTISPKYRWELSHYNYICPVSLRAGEIVEGKSEFAVVFMKYIYFLRDEESMVKFIKNPRPYVLPIRPKPPTRFFILGFPYCGKTTLAKSLAAEFSIPIINANVILKNDLERKKNVYQEFCRQKAEYREIIRLTAQAWRDWRMEEEQRIALIEKWIIYIQSLLSQRIEQFYSLGATDNASGKESNVQSHSAIGSNENFGPESDEGSIRSKNMSKVTEESSEKLLEVRGVPIETGTLDPYDREQTPVDSYSTPSAKIVYAMKHEDYDFNGNGLEVEANLFFSSLWNTFSNEERDDSEKELKNEEEGEDRKSITGEHSDGSVNWCSLLPPQSLSSFLLNKKPYTTREKRKSFCAMLEAASKAYWVPSILKTEFVKWRLPCFMDIPLCEIYLDNPLFLLKYCPEWLKERPLIPDPIDPNHPSVTEAGRKAFNRASVVTISHDRQEIGILLRDAIEKAEREGMRITGEVISPGGWVVDNMVLDLDVWMDLGKENIFADYVYFLIDSDPDYRRIILHWCDLHRDSVISSRGSFQTNSETLVSIKTMKDLEQDNINEIEKLRGSSNLSTSQDVPDIVRMLEESYEVIQQCDKELDDIYKAIIDNGNNNDRYYVPPFLVDPFSHDILQNSIENWCSLKEESLNDEALLSTYSFSDSTRSFFSGRQVSHSTHNLPLGAQLQIFTSKIINSVAEKSPKMDEKIRQKEAENELEFFVSLLSLSQKLDNLKKLLDSFGRTGTIIEVDIYGKTTSEVFFDVKKNLCMHFIKKPRELEQFEIDEIKMELGRQSVGSNKLEVKGEELETETDYEDICIYGESGPFCIVNLERNILLHGKPDFVLRYYGKLYFFWDQKAKNKFIEDPEKYAPYYSPIRCLPPVRIFITGPIGSGKSTLARAISNQCSVHFIDYISLLNSKLVPHIDPGCSKFTALKKHKLLLSENHNEQARLAKERFMKAPYSKRQFWLETSYYVSLEEKQKQLVNNFLISDQQELPENITEFEYKCIESVYEDSEISDVSQSESLTDSSIQEPFVSMETMETKLSDYLVGSGDLSSYYVEKSLKALWSKEPFISQGFVLDGFPFKNNEVEVMIENNWIPDIVLEISLPEDAVIERNIDVKMDEWDVQLKREIVEEKLVEEALNNIRKTLMMIRRSELLSERKSFSVQQESQNLAEITKIASQSEVNISSERKHKQDEKKTPSKVLIVQDESKGEDSLEDEPVGNISTLSQEVEPAIQNEVDVILKKEFPALVFNPVFETYEAGRARIIEDLVANYRRDMEEISKIKASLQSENIPWLTLDGLNEAKKNIIEVFIRLNSLKKRINQKGEFAFAIKMETADKLLQQGYYFLSKFGRWCPVQLYRMKNPIHMFRPLEKRLKITPVVYRNYVYFIGGENEKTHFINDPLKYTFNEPHLPNIPLRIAVIGPPKSGKSTLSSRLGMMFDLKVITMGTALRFVTEKMSGTKLQKTIDEYLKRGCFLPLSVKIEALIACLNDPKCTTQGFVFDGIPFDAATTQSLAEKGKLPFVIISLVGEPDFGKANREKLDLKRFCLPYKQRVNLDLKYKEWNKTYKRFAQWNQDTYNNLYELNAKSNVVDIFYEAYDIIRKSFFAILYYVEYCITERALPLQYLCVSQHEYELRKSSFHNNCPVCWAELNRLNCSSDPPERSGLVQYLNHFYWVCADHMEKFLDRPKMFFPPNAPEAPNLLPKIISRNMFELRSPELKIHGHGRCPVTSIDLPNSLDWEGSWDYAATYADEVFLCKNEEMFKRFLAQPWRYRYADTKFEYNRTVKSQAVEHLGPPMVTSLPPIGFLEQTVADLIHDALQILGLVRPVYPNLSPTCTGCVFVALYLKVYNKRNKTSHLDKPYLDFMLSHCRAYVFRVPAFRTKRNSGNFETEPIDSNESESSENEVHSYPSRTSHRLFDGEEPTPDSYWLDFECQADKKMWSAKNINPNAAKMKLDMNEELVEIPDLPRINVILKYQTYSLRSSPLPPVPNCVTFIYSCKTDLKLPEPFKINSLYQPQPVLVPPFTRSITFNPDKEIFSQLYGVAEPSPPSEPNIWQAKRTISYSTSVESTDKEPDDMDPLLRFMVKRFIPRFQLYDAITPLNQPPMPKVIDMEPIFYNPHRDYSYTILMSEFFHTTHVLRCYEWGDSVYQMELSNKIDKNLGLCNVQSQFLLKPEPQSYVKGPKSVSSYQEFLEAACTFLRVGDYTELDDSEKIKSSESKTSLINFIQMIILENIDQMFAQLSVSDLSYYSYEINDIATDDDMKPVLLVREILPYPPLIWDIMCRPYYAYRSVSSVFDIPRLDHIAHERHVSLLDGIIEPNDRFRFVRYPNSDQTRQDTGNRNMMKKNFKRCGKLHSLTKMKPFYPVFNFFDLHWSSFLPYPFSWAYNMDIKDNFRGSGEKLISTVEESTENLQ